MLIDRNSRTCVAIAGFCRRAARGPELKAFWKSASVVFACALWICVAESVHGALRQECDIAFVGAIFCIVVSKSIFAAAAAGLLGLAVVLLNPVFSGKTAISKWGSIAILSLPLLRVAASLAPDTGMPLALSALVFLGAAATAGYFTVRIDNTLCWIVSVGIASWMPMSVLSNTDYMDKIDPIHIGNYWAFCAGVGLSAPLIALVVYGILRSCLAAAVSLITAVLCLAAGTLMCYAVLERLPVFSKSVEHFVMSISGLMILMAMTRLPGVRNRLFALIMAGLSVALNIFLQWCPVGLAKVSWSLSSNTVIVSELVGEFDIFQGAYDEMNETFKSTPQYLQGRNVLDAAGKWNQAVKSGSPAKRYSFLLILVDALRYASSGYSGRAPRGITPNMDAVAEQAYRFHNAYAQGGWTSISLPSIFWSKYPRWIGFVPLFEKRKTFDLYLREDIPRGMRIWSVHQAPLKEKSRSLAEVLRRNGYRTMASINDGATDYFRREFGFSRGFDEVEYPGDKHAIRRQRKNETLKDVPLDALVADRAIDKLGSLKDERFFMWVHLFSPHHPYTPPLKQYAIPFKKYEGEVFFADLQLGRVLGELERTGRDQDTIVVIASDHGEAFYEHKLLYHGLGLYDEMAKVPVLIKVPGQKGKDIYEQIGLIDIAPTLLAYAGAPIPRSMQGFALQEVMTRNPPAARPPVFLETWQREKNPLSDAKRVDIVGVVGEGHKLIVDLKKKTLSFYDLATDPKEKNNLMQKSLTPEQNALFRRLGGGLKGWQDAHPEP